ncbi:hypothetical protein EAO69_00655 [Streptomyces sp. me109]|nr:hypothetical protein EAO69_00655 [Streptomyces sp. me109]
MVHATGDQPARWKAHTCLEAREGNLMNGQLDVRTALLLLAGCGATYVALLHPAFGTALLVGVGVVTLLHLLLRP